MGKIQAELHARMQVIVRTNRPNNLHFFYEESWRWGLRQTTFADKIKRNADLEYSIKVEIMYCSRSKKKRLQKNLDRWFKTI